MSAPMLPFTAVCLSLFLCAAQDQPAQSQQKEEPKTASIEGIVLNDITKEPVRRVEVNVTGRVLRSGPAVTAGTGTMPQTSATVTDAEGKFKITDLAAGTYYVTLRRNGFLPVYNASAGTVTNLTLTAGEARTGLRYTIMPQAVLTGRVLDDEGDPVQNAMVQYVTQRRFRGRKTWVPGGQSANTNDRGEFRLTEVPPGRYRLMVQFWDQRPVLPGPPGQPRMGYALSYYPGVVDATQASLVEATAGSETNGLDINLKRVPVFQIRGKVFDADGQPARRYGAAVAPQEGAFVGTGRLRHSGDDGSFVIDGVPNGTWTLNVSIPGTGPRREDGRQSARLTAEVNGRDIDGLEIHLGRGPTVSGAIAVETAGRASQARTPALYVSATPADSGTARGVTPVKAAPDGSFTLKLADPGRYFLTAYATAGSGLYLDSVKVGGEEHYGRPVELGAGADVAVKLVLRADGGKITGTLDHGDGERPGGTTLALLIPADPALRDSTIGRSIRQVGQNGAFTFDNIRPGEYLVAAGIGADYEAVSALEDAKDFESRAQRVKVTAGDSTSVQLKPIVVSDH